MFYIGIDLAKDTFTITGLTTPQDVRVFGLTLPNAPAGFAALLAHAEGETLMIMEATGVYGDKLRHFLHAHGMTPAVEPANFIRRAFRVKRKSDPVDSRMIAEYGYRYADQLHYWTPTLQIIEQIRLYLTSRELLVKQRTAHKNLKKSLTHREYALRHRHDTIIDFLTDEITTIEEELWAALATSAYREQIALLDSIPGCRVLYAANFLVLTDGFVNLDFRALGNYLGIVPHEYCSGARVYKRPKSDHKGPDRMRKMLYLAAMSAIKSGKFGQYFQKKTQEGKPGKVILNNLMNKLLKISCAVVKSGEPYKSP